MRTSVVTLEVERGLHDVGYTRVGGVDEVGRGAPAGPVCVGVVVVEPTVTRSLEGVADSKLLSPSKREALVPRIREWSSEWAVGFASAHEVDLLGLTGALRCAGLRALAQLATPLDVVLLDGSHDWLTPRTHTELFAEPAPEFVAIPRVVTRVKADLSCASVAAASILAKVARDDVMRSLAREHPEFQWQLNKGYATAAHWQALRERGPTKYHRRSWHLPAGSEDQTTWSTSGK